MSQNLGGLLGSAVLGTFQTAARNSIRASWSSTSRSSIRRSWRASSKAAAPTRKTIADPALRNAESAVALASAATREATVLSYNDVFFLIAGIALVTVLIVLVHSAWQRFMQPVSAAPGAGCRPSAANAAPGTAAPLTDTV